MIEKRNGSLAPTTIADALNKTLETPSLDPILLSIANKFLEGESINEIASSFSISSDRVTQIIEKKEVKSYVDNVYLTQGYLNRIKRINIINSVIEQKLEEAMETGQYTKKDLLDWMKHLHDVETSVRPKDKTPTVAVQVNNYDSLMKEVLD
jgi:predicted DNA-binding protein YlxM (UPF0122 family)